MLVETLTSTFVAAGLATVLAPYITQVTKRKLGVDSLWAYGLHILVSGALSFAALYISGELNVKDLAGTFTAVAVGSQTLFQIFKKKSGLKTEGDSEEPPPVE